MKKFEQAQSLNKKNSENPILPGSIFDPAEELKKIKHNKEVERKNRLDKFKEKFVYQKEGLAKMQEEIINLIRQDPDIKFHTLSSVVKDYAKQYGMTEQQINITKEIIAQYTTKHRAIEKFVQNHPRKEDIFQALFGEEPKGEIEVAQGPMTLYFRCHNIEDYALIYSQSFLNNRYPTSEEINIASMSGGVSIGTALVPELEGTIIAENTEGRKFYENYPKSTIIHEEQHALKRLFRETMRCENAFRNLRNAKTDEEKKKSLKQYLRWFRESEQYEARLKDEILAFLKDGHSDKETYYYLTLPKDQGGIYDYSFTERQSLPKFISEKTDVHKTLIEDTIREIFIKENKDIIKTGIKAFRILQACDYSDEQVIAFLIQEPLAKWLKTAERLVKQKYKNNNNFHQ